MASLEIRPIHSPTSAMLTVNSTLILSWEHKWVSEPRSLVPTESGQTTEAIHHAVTTEEATIAAIGTTQGAIVVHSPDKTEGDNDVSFQTITVITTGIAPSVTIQISPDGRYATVAKSLAQVAEAGNVKVVETISNAETVSRAVGVKPSTITIGPALNARILIFHSVRSATDVKPHAPEAVAADEVVAVAEATETVALQTEVVEAEIMLVAVETDAVVNAAEAITVRPKESGLVMHITVHHVTCSRVSLNAKTRTEEAI